jgi:hypothetical protein
MAGRMTRLTEARWEALSQVICDLLSSGVVINH